MSSRLFQSIREDRGLAYNISSEMAPFHDTGSIAVYAGTSASHTQTVLDLTLQELARFKNETVTPAELKRAQDQLKSNIVIGLESSGSRMANLARQQMYFGRFFGVEEITREIEAITPEDIQRLARELFLPDLMALTLLGNLGPMKVTRDQLAC
jgi:predicted Zn-dependent peptidase